MRKGISTYGLHELHTVCAAFVRGIIRKLQRILEDRVGHLLRCASIKWTSEEQQLVDSDTEAPPVDTPCVSFPSHNFWSHVGQTPGNTSVQPTFRIMDSNIEVSNMCMALCIKQYIIWFKVTAAPFNDERYFSIRKVLPMYDALLVQINESRN